MDHSERMARMREEMERRRRELEERLGAIRDNAGRISPEYRRQSTGEKSATPTNGTTRQLPLLKRHDGLEDETETKIGMFDRLYESQYMRFETAAHTFGYDTIDYAPLINPLVCLVEIELDKALSPIARKRNINYRRMFGDFITILRNDSCRRLLSGKINDLGKAIESVEAIQRMRNSVSHKGVIDRDAFLTFYNGCYLPFFNETLPQFIELKHSWSKSSFGNENVVYDHQSISQSRLFDNRGDNSATPPFIAVILTDTEQLSIKYFRDINIGGVNGPAVITRRLLEPYVESAAHIGLQYLLLDAANPDYGRYLDKERGWQSWLEMLDRFRLAHLSDVTACVGLFIIGGDDVVPMPRLRSPISNAVTDSTKTEVLESTIEADWIYGFDKSHITLDEEGHLDFDRLSGAKVHFHVGRLPLESGLMASDYEDDIRGYLVRSLGALHNGISVSRVGAVGCRTCRIITTKVVDGFPQLRIDDMDERYRQGNAFISPQLRLDLDEDSPDLPAVVTYINRIKECDIVTTVLHGGPAPTMPTFCGEQRSMDGIEQPTAFAPFMYDGARVKIMVPVCCWGARFIGYQRNCSSLLSAFLDHEVLLYMGSCRTVYGQFDINFMDADGNIVAEPYLQWGEWLVRLFMQRLMEGYPAGLALVLAKNDYLAQHSTGTPEDMLTVLQFNLFGDPMLYVIPEDAPSAFGNRPATLRADMETPLYVRNTNFSYHETEVDNPGLTGHKSILERIRSLVDRNLDDITHRLGDMVYRQYGIDPRTLRHIARYTAGRGEHGLRFEYSEDGNCPSITSVYTDPQGNIRRIARSF
ncbi:MAG: C25 family cysteine peptidase [Pseudoflavonifractor sp.]|nr:C25 family cysteine peptidase [Pseudoflavonifractor sp.]